jgi:hypothetical protein
MVERSRTDMDTADSAHAVIQAQRRQAAVSDDELTAALSAATRYALDELADNRDPQPHDLRRLMAEIQGRWPVLGATDRSWAVGFGCGVVEERDRLLAKLPTAGSA